MIPLVAPCYSLDERNQFAPEAPWVAEFEQAFADRVGCAGAVAVCSGTVALELALDVLEIVTVSIPTYACTALRQACHSRAIHYVDSRYSVESAQITHQDSTVLVHMFGLPASGGGRVAVEDYTLSLGAIDRLRGQVGVCSTHESKMISTGVGGVVFADWDLSPVRRLVAERSVAMSSTQAALGISQLEQLDGFIRRRREIAAVYSDRFEAVGIDCPDPECGSVFFRYLISVPDPEQSVTDLHDVGIEAGRGVYPPLHRLAGIKDDRFPGATWCVNHLLSVPCHPSLSDEDVAYVAYRIVELCAP